MGVYTVSRYAPSKTACHVMCSVSDYHISVCSKERFEKHVYSQCDLICGVINRYFTNTI